MQGGSLYKKIYLGKTYEFCTCEKPWIGYNCAIDSTSGTPVDKCIKGSFIIQNKNKLFSLKYLVLILDQGNWLDYTHWGNRYAFCQCNTPFEGAGCAYIKGPGANQFYVGQLPKENIYNNN